MALDTPSRSVINGQNVTVGQPFVYGGWAVDLGAASGTGVDTVHVWAWPTSGAAAIFLGAAPYGAARPAAATSLGEQFRNSGFSISVSGLGPGSYQIVATLRSAVTNTFSYAQSVTITIPTPNVIVTVDAPSVSQTVTQPFVVTGWAIDTSHPTASGVSLPHVYAYPVGGGAGIVSVP